MQTVDESQVKISLPVALSMAVGLSLIVGSALVYYFAGQVTLEGRVSTVEASTKELPDLKKKIEALVDSQAEMSKGMTILLIDRGYDPDKVFAQKKP